MFPAVSLDMDIEKTQHCLIYGYDVSQCLIRLWDKIYVS